VTVVDRSSRTVTDVPSSLNSGRSTLHETVGNGIVVPPTPRRHQIAQKRLVCVSERHVCAGRLKPAQRSAGDELSERRSEECCVHRATAHQDATSRSLCKAFASARHRDDDQAAISDEEFEYGIRCHRCLNP
jgi:hypothetical protein